MASGCQRQLPRRTRNPKDEQNPTPPPLGGGVSSFWGENKTRPCATIRGRLEGGVGKQHHRSCRPALLEVCDPVVSESGGSGQPPGERKLISPPLREAAEKNWEIGRKRKKQAQTGLQRQRSEARDGLDGKQYYPPLRGCGWRRLRAARIAETLSSGDRV